MIINGKQIVSWHMCGCHVHAKLVAQFSFSVEGEDFTVLPPDVFEVIFPTGTVNGTTVCDLCSIINDDDLEGDHSFAVHVQRVAPGMIGITTDLQYTTVEITDDEGEYCS